MSRKEEKNRVLFNLYNLGFDADDAGKLRGIAMTLSRWAEASCNGDICRDESTGICYRHYGHNTNGPFLTVKCADRETGALRRLGKIMEAHPELGYYHQGDPRGCSLYIYKLESLAKMSGTIDCCYSSIGIAVY